MSKACLTGFEYFICKMLVDSRIRPDKLESFIEDSMLQLGDNDHFFLAPITTMTSGTTLTRIKKSCWAPVKRLLNRY
jgi:hypothetical protein